MIKKIDHIGIAVKSIESSLANLKKIFSLFDLHLEVVEEQKVKIASFKVGNVKIELTEPTSEDSPIHKFLEKRGEGIHHIAFEVVGIAEELKRLSELNIHLINSVPTLGAHNMQIAFLHPKSTNGVLIEFCEK
ncbi:MAG: methylmalonyl-CoA epimerase [Candidatus Kapaibacteriales bacterium]